MITLANAQRVQSDLATKALGQYRLPTEVLPFAPTRTPFLGFGSPALNSAMSHAIRIPEKRGMMSHAARSILGIELPPLPEAAVTMEAHLDAAEIPPALGDALVSAGFELDGFVLFEPRRFSAHYTSKFKVGRSAADRRAKLWSKLRSACNEARTLLDQFPNVEAYLELEIYTNQNRRFWEDRQCSADVVDLLPLRGGELHMETPSRLAAATAWGSLSEVRKKADIHVKIQHHGWANQTRRQELIERLCRTGFYRVVTWAGNDILTAQFFRSSDAKLVFDRLAVHFASHGGASEMTMETASGMWRTINQCGRERLLAEVPPLVMSIE